MSEERDCEGWNVVWASEEGSEQNQGWVLVESLQKQEDAVKPELKACTLEKLVEKACSPEYRSKHSGLPDTILYTFPYYATPNRLLKLLIQQWKEHQGEGNDIRIRASVGMFMQHWLRKIPHHFHNNPKLSKAMAYFLEAVKSDYIVQQVAKAYREQVVNYEAPPKPFLATVTPEKAGTLRDQARSPLYYDAKKVAQQLHLMEWELQAAVKPEEFLKQAWIKRTDIAPNMLASINWFNLASRWIASQILQGRSAADRTKLIAHMIDIAHYSLEMGNYNYVMESLSALGHASIDRLTAEWEALPEASQAKMQEMQRIFSHKKNFTNYRQALRLASSALPYVGVFLTDLTFIDDTAEDYIDAPNDQDGKPLEAGARRLINVEKACMTGTIVESLCTLHGMPPKVEPDDMIRKWIATSEIWDDDQLYNASLICKPRASKKDAEEGTEEGSKRRVLLRGASKKSDNELPDLPEGPRDITERDWQLIMAAGLTVPFQEGEVLLAAGEVNQNIFRLKSGECSVEVPVKGTTETRTVTTLKPPVVFGEISLLGKEAGAATASVVAAGAGEVQVATAEYLHSLFQHDAGLSERFFKYLAVKLASRLREMDQMPQKDAKKDLQRRKLSVREESTNLAALEQEIKRAQGDVGFQKQFDLPSSEALLKSYSGVELKQRQAWNKSTAYISHHYLCFSTRIFGMNRREVINIEAISDVQATKKAMILKFTRKGKRYKYQLRASTPEKLQPMIDLLQGIRDNRKEAVVRVTDKQSASSAGASIKIVSGSRKGSGSSVSLKNAACRMESKDWDVLLSGSQTQSFGAGEVVVEQGKEYQNLYYIKSGSCLIQLRSDERSSEETVGEMTEGEMFGELSMLLGGAASASVIAKPSSSDGQVEVVVLRGYLLRTIFACQPHLPGKFFSWLASLLSRRIRRREDSKLASTPRSAAVTAESLIAPSISIQGAKKMEPPKVAASTTKERELADAQSTASAPPNHPSVEALVMASKRKESMARKASFMARLDNMVAAQANQNK